MNNDIKFLNTESRTWYSLTKFLRPFWIACPSYFFRPQYVWFPSYLYVGSVPNSSGQLAELIVGRNKYSTRVICIVTRSYCFVYISYSKFQDFSFLPLPASPFLQIHSVAQPAEISVPYSVPALDWAPSCHSACCPADSHGLPRSHSSVVRSVQGQRSSPPSPQWGDSVVSYPWPVFGVSDSDPHVTTEAQVNLSPDLPSLWWLLIRQQWPTLGEKHQTGVTNQFPYSIQYDSIKVTHDIYDELMG